VPVRREMILHQLQTTSFPDVVVGMDLASVTAKRSVGKERWACDYIRVFHMNRYMRSRKCIFWATTPSVNSAQWSTCDVECNVDPQVPLVSL
jgi:hypothetical protein